MTRSLSHCQWGGRGGGRILKLQCFIIASPCPLEALVSALPTLLYKLIMQSPLLGSKYRIFLWSLNCSTIIYTLSSSSLNFKTSAGGCLWPTAKRVDIFGTKIILSFWSQSNYRHTSEASRLSLSQWISGSFQNHLGFLCYALVVFQGVSWFTLLI